MTPGIVKAVDDDREPISVTGTLTAEQMHTLGVRWYGDGAGDTVVVDRARFERLLTAAEAAYEWTNAPAKMASDHVLFDAVDALQSSDLDPVP